MSSYLVVKNSTNTLSYPCKTTHTGNPYLKVDTGYLDLTTETTTGTYVVVKSGESSYRPKKSTSGTIITSMTDLGMSTFSVYQAVFSSDGRTSKESTKTTLSQTYFDRKNSSLTWSCEISNNTSFMSISSLWCQTKTSSWDGYEFRSLYEHVYHWNQESDTPEIILYSTGSNFSHMGESIEYEFSTIESVSANCYAIIYHSVSKFITNTTHNTNLSYTYSYSDIKQNQDRLNQSMPIVSKRLLSSNMIMVTVFSSRYGASQSLGSMFADTNYSYSNSRFAYSLDSNYEKMTIFHRASTSAFFSTTKPSIMHTFINDLAYSNMTFNIINVTVSLPENNNSITLRSLGGSYATTLSLSQTNFNYIGTTTFCATSTTTYNTEI